MLPFQSKSCTLPGIQPTDHSLYLYMLHQRTAPNCNDKIANVLHVALLNSNPFHYYYVTACTCQSIHVVFPQFFSDDLLHASVSAKCEKKNKKHLWTYLEKRCFFGLSSPVNTLSLSPPPSPFQLNWTNDIRV